MGRARKREKVCLKIESEERMGEKVGEVQGERERERE